MSNIVFTAIIGDEIKIIEITPISQGTKRFRVFFDCYFEGDLYYRRGKWHFTNDTLNADDVLTLVEMLKTTNNIESLNPQPNH